MKKNISNIEEYRKERKRKKRKKRLITALIFLILIAIIILIAFFSLKGDASQDTDDANLPTTSVDTGITANGFPIGVGGSGPLDLKRCSGNLFLLTKNNLIVFDQKGEQIHSGYHGYSNPVLEVSSKRALTYDQGGFHFRIDSNRSQMGNKKLVEKIIYGVISDDGYVAVVTQTQRHTIRLTVYDPNLNELLNWSVSDQVITGIDFNNSSTACMVVSYSISDGASYSRATELRFQKDAPEHFATTLSDCMALSVNYLANNNISIITDQKAFVLDKNGQIKAEWEYLGDLTAYDNECETGATLFLEDGGEIGNTLVWKIDTDGVKAATAQISDKITDAFADDARLLVLTDKRLIAYNNQLEEVSRSDLTDLPTQVVKIGNKGYVLTVNKLEQIDLS